MTGQYGINVMVSNVICHAVANQNLMPPLVLALLKMTSNRALMGEHRNSGWVNGVLITLAVVASYFAYRNGMDWWMEGASEDPIAGALRVLQLHTVIAE